jgi:hypothetical protein
MILLKQQKRQMEVEGDAVRTKLLGIRTKANQVKGDSKSPIKKKKRMSEHDKALDRAYAQVGICEAYTFSNKGGQHLAAGGSFWGFAVRRPPPPPLRRRSGFRSGGEKKARFPPSGRAPTRRGPGGTGSSPQNSASYATKPSSCWRKYGRLRD